MLQRSMTRGVSPTGGILPVDEGGVSPSRAASPGGYLSVAPLRPAGRLVQHRPEEARLERRIARMVVPTPRHNVGRCRSRSAPAASPLRRRLASELVVQSCAAMRCDRGAIEGVGMVEFADFNTANGEPDDRRYLASDRSSAKQADGDFLGRSRRAMVQLLMQHDVGVGEGRCELGPANGARIASVRSGRRR
jgi:hypothetical protein